MNPKQYGMDGTRRGPGVRVPDDRESINLRRITRELEQLDPLTVKLAIITDNPGRWVHVTANEIESLALGPEAALPYWDIDEAPDALDVVPAVYDQARHRETYEPEGDEWPERWSA